VACVALEGRRIGELLGVEPFAESLQRPDIPGDSDRSKRGLESDDPSVKRRRRQFIDPLIRRERAPETSQDIRYEVAVLGEMPSAALAARNRSIA
jgi:hypothetical protein